MQSSQSFVSCTNRIRPLVGGVAAVAAFVARPLTPIAVVMPITIHRRIAFLPPQAAHGRSRITGLRQPASALAGEFHMRAPGRATSPIRVARAWQTGVMDALTKEAPGPGLTLTQVPEPEVGINDVLIRVDRTGICGTDLHIF